MDGVKMLLLTRQVLERRYLPLYDIIQGKSYLEFLTCLKVIGASHKYVKPRFSFVYVASLSVFQTDAEGTCVKVSG